MSHIANLTALFQGNTVRTLNAHQKLYRGCWLPKKAFPNGYWFSPTLDGAAQYVAMHAEEAKPTGRIPFIYEVSAKRDLMFVEFHGSHITAFYSAYGRDWRHEELANDIPKALTAANLVAVDGFIRPNSSEYFLTNPAAALDVTDIISKAAALSEASRVKRYEV